MNIDTRETFLGVVQAACSRCGTVHSRGGQRYCLSCHNAYMRDWRKSHPLSEEPRRKDNARSYAGVYKHRGRIVPEPCVECGAGDAQMHHENYDSPLDITWLCKPCHMALHRSEAA